MASPSPIRAVAYLLNRTGSLGMHAPLDGPAGVRPRLEQLPNAARQRGIGGLHVDVLVAPVHSEARAGTALDRRKSHGSPLRLLSGCGRPVVIAHFRRRSNEQRGS